MSFHNNVQSVISTSHFCNQCSLRKTIDRPILQKLVHLYNQYSLGKTIDRPLLQKIDQEIYNTLHIIVKINDIKKTTAGY